MPVVFSICFGVFSSFIAKMKRGFFFWLKKKYHTGIMVLLNTAKNVHTGFYTSVETRLSSEHKLTNTPGHSHQ